MARKPTNETFAQRQARTANARAAKLLSPPPPPGTPEERSKRAVELNKIRWDRVRTARAAGPGFALPDDAA